jgi:hypothetical protein
MLGAHAFDLLDKIASEVGDDEPRARVVACRVLDAIAMTGAPVVRIWGSLKRTGDAVEPGRAARALAWVLDENARRQRPLRFVIALMNHQSGYGAPDPTQSLDDQRAGSAWSSARLYREGSWRARGEGLLSDRVDAFASDDRIRASTYVLGWEVINELDTFRAVANGSLEGPQADTLRSSFAVPALELLAKRFEQPILLGEVRGKLPRYDAFVGALIDALSPEARARLVWTSHVYLSEQRRSIVVGTALDKLDHDLALASARGLPLLVGEIGLHASGPATRYCDATPPHAFARVLERALSGPRATIDLAIAWGEGLCRLALPSGAIDVGAGGDTADLGPTDPGRADLAAARRTPRFSISPP